MEMDIIFLFSQAPQRNVKLLIEHMPMEEKQTTMINLSSKTKEPSLSQSHHQKKMSQMGTHSTQILRLVIDFDVTNTKVTQELSLS